MNSHAVARGYGLLEVLGETQVAAEPSEGPLIHPTPVQGLEDIRGVGSLDDLDRPFPDLAQWMAKLVAG